MTELTMIVLATLAGGVVSVLLAASLALTVLARWADRLVSFAVGVMLAAALLNLWPEAANALGPDVAGAWLLGGVVAFFVLEKLSLWRHDHGHAGGPSPHAPAVPMILIGDGLHNFVDGVLIAAAFLQDPALGVATSVAVIAHEVPQEIGDFMVLLSAGVSRRRALLLNTLSGATAVLGGVLGYFALRGLESVLPYVLAIAAASFVYIAVADLVPELHKARRQLTAMSAQVGLMAIGIAAVALLHQH